MTRQRNENTIAMKKQTENIDTLRLATPEELMLRYKRASLVLLLGEIKSLNKAYEKATGFKAPSVLTLVKENI